MDLLPLLSWLADHFAIPTFGAVIWFARRQDKHHLTLYGENEDNGLRGTVKDLRNWRHNVANPKLQEHTFQIAEHESRLDHLDAQHDRGIA